MALRVGTRACENRQGRPHGQEHRGHAHRLHTVTAGQYDRQTFRGTRSDGPECFAVGPPERDRTGATGITGQEDGTAADECGELRGRGKSCLRSDDVFLKFD
ncbi:hypothetical protein GCM10010424_39960 [Streptomyces lienomycini]